MPPLAHTPATRVGADRRPAAPPGKHFPRGSAGSRFGRRDHGQSYLGDGLRDTDAHRPDARRGEGLRRRHADADQSVAFCSCVAAQHLSEGPNREQPLHHPHAA